MALPNEMTAGAPAMPQQNAPAQNDLTIGSVPLAVGNVNPANSGNPANPGNPGRSRGKKFARGKETHVLQAEAKVNTLAIKCYEEQLPFGEAYFINAIRTADPKEYYVIAIRHNRDLVTDGIWTTATVKPHWHVIARLVDSKGRWRVINWMEKLGRIKFRPGIDDQLWEDHGVETIGNFAGYALYLTHETADAIRDGKEKYEMDELVSNLTIEQIEDIRAGYIRVTANKKKLTPEELAALDQEAHDLGCKMGNFDAWYGLQPFIVRSSTKIKTIRESYHRGVEARIVDDPKVIRLCVFIKGAPDSGKTYAAIEGLPGKRILMVGGGGTGKFDRLRPDHDAIIIDDDVCPNLLNMSDNYICYAYKRQSNNPAWAGDYLIVTSNLTFDEWLKNCGIDDDKHKEAVRSRFYICDVCDTFEGPLLNLITPSERGTAEEQLTRLEMFRKFQAGFDASIGKYSNSDRHVDYSSDIGSVRLRSLPYEAEAYDHARWDAIIEFACWFWSSTAGGFACYYDDHPAEWKDAESEIRFVQNDAELKKAIRKCRQYFSGSDSPVLTRSGNAYCKAGDLVRTLSVDELLEPVRLAWWDYFGNVQPLTADRGYDSWRARVIEKARGEGHKYCRGCRRIFPLESRFCSLCGKPLPDDTVYGDINFVSARIHLADERGCDVADVPDEDVTALVYKADGHDCGIMLY